MKGPLAEGQPFSYHLKSGKCSLALVCSGKSAKGNVEQAGEKAEVAHLLLSQQGTPPSVRPSAQEV